MSFTGPGNRLTSRTSTENHKFSVTKNNYHVNLVEQSRHKNTVLNHLVSKLSNTSSAYQTLPNVSKFLVNGGQSQISQALITSIYTTQKDQYNSRDLSNEAEKFLDRLSATVGPTRFGANALTATQLDRSSTEKPQAISDHLPISFVTKQTSSSGDNVSIASWNLLAEEHKNNNYNNIEVDSMSQKLYESGKLDYFGGSSSVSSAWLYSDIADEIMASEKFQDISVRDSFFRGEQKGIEAFTNFLENDYTTSNYANLRPSRRFSKDEQIHNRRIARENISNVILNDNKSGKLDVHSGFYPAAVSAVKLRTTLNHGSLEYSARINALANNLPLLNQIAQHDVLTLQECTDPKAFVSLLNSTNPAKNFKYISHKTSESPGKNDHCVIVYDSNEWSIDDKNIHKLALGGNKPGIIAKFTSNLDNKDENSMIMGSIHYPGSSPSSGKSHTEKNHLTESVQKALDELKSSGTEAIFISGDFNQGKSSLAGKVAELNGNYAVIEPEGTGGTMAGPDWERSHEGHTIDLGITNLETTGKKIEPRYFV